MSDAHAQAVDAAAVLAGVVMAPEWRAAVIANFTTIAAAAVFVAAFPLDDAAEYAPVFTA